MTDDETMHRDSRLKNRSWADRISILRGAKIAKSKRSEERSSARSRPSYP